MLIFFMCNKTNYNLLGTSFLIIRRWKMHQEQQFDGPHVVQDLLGSDCLTVNVSAKSDDSIKVSANLLLWKWVVESWNERMNLWLSGGLLLQLFVTDCLSPNASLAFFSSSCSAQFRDPQSHLQTCVGGNWIWLRARWSAVICIFHALNTRK